MAPARSGTARHNAHMTRVISVAVGVSCVRIPSVAYWLSSILDPLVSGEERTGIPPLSLLNWIVHLIIVPLGTELSLALLQSGNKRVRSFGWTFVLGEILGGLLLCSHSTIDRNPVLESQLYQLARTLIRLEVFLTGIVIFWPQIGWFASVPLFYLSHRGTLGFSNLGGIALSNLALIAVGWLCLQQQQKKGQDLNVYFAVGYVLLAFAPFLTPTSSTDANHTTGATIMIGIFIWLLLSSFLSSSKISPPKKKV